MSNGFNPASYHSKHQQVPSKAIAPFHPQETDYDSFEDDIDNCLPPVPSVPIVDQKHNCIKGPSYSSHGDQPYQSTNFGREDNRYYGSNHKIHPVISAYNGTDTLKNMRGGQARGPPDWYDEPMTRPSPTMSANQRGRDVNPRMGMGAGGYFPDMPHDPGMRSPPAMGGRMPAPPLNPYGYPNDTSMNQMPTNPYDNSEPPPRRVQPPPGHASRPSGAANDYYNGAPPNRPQTASGNRRDDYYPDRGPPEEEEDAYFDAPPGRANQYNRPPTAPPAQNPRKWGGQSPPDYGGGAPETDRRMRDTGPLPPRAQMGRGVMNPDPHSAWPPSMGNNRGGDPYEQPPPPPPAAASGNSRRRHSMHVPRGPAGPGGAPTPGGAGGYDVDPYTNVPRDGRYDYMQGGRGGGGMPADLSPEEHTRYPPRAGGPGMPGGKPQRSRSTRGGTPATQRYRGGPMGGPGDWDGNGSIGDDSHHMMDSAEDGMLPPNHNLMKIKDLTVRSVYSQFLYWYNDSNHTPQAEFFCCPFYRSNPTRHSNCGSVLLKNINKVRKHVLRDHRLPVYCPVCMQTFGDENERDAHSGMQDCQPGQYTKPEGLTHDQTAHISHVAKSAGPPEDQWFKMFRVISNANFRPSPYMDRKTARDLYLLQLYFREVGNDTVVHQVNQSFPAFAQPTREELVLFQQLISQECLRMLSKHSANTHAPSARTPDSTAWPSLSSGQSDSQRTPSLDDPPAWHTGGNMGPMHGDYASDYRHGQQDVPVLGAPRARRAKAPRDEWAEPAVAPPDMRGMRGGHNSMNPGIVGHHDEDYGYRGGHPGGMYDESAYYQ